MEIKIMVVPGKIARIILTTGMTVLGACEQAERQVPGVGWVELARDREVRVQNRKFSNTDETVEGTYGSIQNTALNDGDVVLILTKIKGNSDAVLICSIDGAEYALETPVEARVALVEAAGINLADVDHIRINGKDAELSRLIGNGDRIEVIRRQSPRSSVASQVMLVGILGPVQEYISGLESTIGTLRDRVAELEESAKYEETAIFGRLNSELLTVSVGDDTTVQDLLDEHGDLREYEAVFYNGQPLASDDLDETYVEDGDSVLVVPTTKNGRRVKFDIN